MPYVGLKPASVDWLQASNNHARRAARRVAILLFDGFSLLGAGLVAELFHMANKISSSDASDDFVYEVCFLSLEGGNIACSSSVRIWTEGLDAGDYIGFDVLFIAGGVGAHSAAGNERLLCWLRTIYPKTANVTPIAEGCAVLAAAGIVRNREAPREPRACAIRSPSESGIHHDSLKSALAIIKRDLGVDVARGVADRLMPAWSIELVPRLNDAGTTSLGDKIRASARWLHENCERTISVADAAEIAAMSERHFLRCFKLEMGITPSDYLLQARLDTACSLLIETELPIDKIARRIGMSNGDRLAKIFRKRMSISPGEFRRHIRPVG
ncbi:GlxA family transcriptional regulator [Cupriavidus sp. 8B]